MRGNRSDKKLVQQAEQTGHALFVQAGVSGQSIPALLGGLQFHLMQRFGQIRQKLERIRQLCNDEEVQRLTEEIIEEL